VYLRSVLFSAADVSGQLRATAALPLGKELRYPLNRSVKGEGLPIICQAGTQRGMEV
jgi:hypothetical protein